MIAPSDREPIAVVFAADGHYAMPLAVTVRSLLDNLGPQRRVQLFVLSCGIEEPQRERLLESWDLRCADITWQDDLLPRVNHLEIWSTFGPTVYFRLLIPQVLPAHIHRAIYIDSDALVVDDVEKLWRTDLQGNCLGAVQDVIMPVMADAILGLEDFGLAPESPYFNAGVLLLDLDAWRAEELTDRLLRFIHRNSERIRWPDQDALNLVLAGRWLQLDARWNRFAQQHQPDEDAGIIHYVSAPKPWSTEYAHLSRALFFHYLDRTAWSGWRPEAKVQVRPRPPPSFPP